MSEYRPTEDDIRRAADRLEFSATLCSDMTPHAWRWLRDNAARIASLGAKPVEANTHAPTINDAGAEPPKTREIECLDCKHRFEGDWTVETRCPQCTRGFALPANPKVSASDFEGDGKLDITGGMDSAEFIRKIRDA